MKQEKIAQLKNSANKLGYTPLHVAAQLSSHVADDVRKSQGIIKILLESSVNFNTVDAEGYSPLHLAVLLNNSHVTKERHVKKDMTIKKGKPLNQ